MAFVAVVTAVLAALGLLWWLAGRRPTGRSRPATRGSTAITANRTSTRAGGELNPAPGPAVTSVAESILPPAPTISLLDDQALDPQTALALTALADALPRPRGVMLQLLEAGDDPANVARVVASDPATAALLLRTVNSAQFGLLREITSVQHAITYLGANLVRDVALHHAMAVPVDTRNLTAERLYQGLWRDSYLASGIAHTLAQHCGWPAPSVLSTQALLFRLGDIALLSHRPELASLYNTDPDLSDLVDGTQQMLGFNSAMVGAHLAQVWGLPRPLCDTLRRSLAPLVGDALRDAQRLSVTVGYFSTRLAQAVSRLPGFDLPAAMDDLMQRAEAHYLPAYLADVGLPDPLAVLADPAVARRIGSLVTRN